jgi:hypothetical protein
VSIPTFRAGIFKALGSFDPMMVGSSGKVRSCAADHRFDEPARLSLDLGCMPAEPASVSPGEVIVAPVDKD